MQRTHRILTPRTGEEGYTLTEMLVVIAIIGLIAAVLTPTLLGQLSRARVKAAQLQLKTMAASVEAYRQDVGQYPTPSEGLKALVEEPAAKEGWTGPYVEELSGLNDPWGKPVQYTLDPATQRFRLTSLGADGTPGGKSANRDIQVPAVR